MAKINSLNVLIVDDHQILLDGLKLLLKKTFSIENIFQASDGKSALEIVSMNNIDMVISDINMPGMSGIELTKIIKVEYPHTRILILTMYNDSSIIHEILDSEAEGYILKNSGKEELLKAIAKIIDNGTYYSNEVINLIQNDFKYKNQKKTEKENKDPIDNLTPREIEILKLICNEYSSVEISEKLFVSKFTVDTHRRNILNKTNSKTIVSLIKFALKNNILENK